MAKKWFLNLPQSEDRELKVNFNQSQNSFKVNLTKTSSNFDMRIETGGRASEDIYYDEVVIYDGGGVEGYGYNKE